jgi:hypothetical protein
MASTRPTIQIEQQQTDMRSPPPDWYTTWVLHSSVRPDVRACTRVTTRQHRTEPHSTLCAAESHRLNVCCAHGVSPRTTYMYRHGILHSMPRVSDVQRCMATRRQPLRGQQSAPTATVWAAAQQFLWVVPAALWMWTGKGGSVYCTVASDRDCRSLATRTVPLETSGVVGWSSASSGSLCGAIFSNPRLSFSRRCQRRCHAVRKWMALCWRVKFGSGVSRPRP